MGNIKILDKKDVEAMADNRYWRKEFTPWNTILYGLVPIVVLFLIVGLVPEPYDWFSMIPLIYFAVVCIKSFVGVKRYEKEFLKEWGEL